MTTEVAGNGVRAGRRQGRKLLLTIAHAHRIAALPNVEVHTSTPVRSVRDFVDDFLSTCTILNLSEGVF